LTENGDIRWSILYDCFIEEINKNSSDLLGLAVDNEEEEINEEEKLKEENENN